MKPCHCYCYPTRSFDRYSMSTFSSSKSYSSDCYHCSLFLVLSRLSPVACFVCLSRRQLTSVFKKRINILLFMILECLSEIYMRWNGDWRWCPVLVDPLTLLVFGTNELLHGRVALRATIILAQITFVDSLGSAISHR